MSKRDEILGRVRHALGVRGDEAKRRGLVRARLEHPSAGPIPARAQAKGAALIALFSEKLEGQGAVVLNLEAPAALPGAIAELLRRYDLPMRIRTGEDALFAGLDWEAAGITHMSGPGGGDDKATLSHALGGAAETGTLFLASGAANPSTLNFLPELHIIAIHADTIGGSYEQGWALVRAAYGRREMPRTLNWISGPSRTADIEQTLIRGAHGPKELAVIIIGA